MGVAIKMATSLRYVPNPCSSYIPKDKPYSESQEARQIVKKAREWLKENIIKFQSLYPPTTEIVPSSDPRKKSRDPSIYTGLGGNAFVHWKLVQYYKHEGDEDKATDHIMQGFDAIHTSLSMTDNTERNVAFYIGNPGLCTVAALLYNDYQEPVKTEHYLTQLLSYLPQVLSSHDELLFGKAGYMSCLLLVKRYLPDVMCERVKLNDVLYQVFTVLIQSGSSSSYKYLRYYLYGQDYIGAAHGTAGILYMLLQCPIEWCKDPEVESWIKKTLDHLVSLQLPDGNFPVKDSTSRKDSTSPVHWCHGSPGIVPVLYRAYKVYGDSKYLTSVSKGLQCIWKYGILKKGIGLCHGITGNAYTFLMMYQCTSNEDYYYNALQMGQCVWNEDIMQIISSCSDPQRYKTGQPDHPMSLMEGLGGAICFFCDLLQPSTACFPGYIEI